jgi:CPA2 family monovalent cation:H+ antiporter-2
MRLRPSGLVWALLCLVITSSVDGRVRLAQNCVHNKAILSSKVGRIKRDSTSLRLRGGAIVNDLLHFVRDSDAAQILVRPLSADPKMTSAAVILTTVTIAIRFCERISLTPVIGLLAAGAMMGPTGRGWIAKSNELSLMGDIGILLFLFEIGMELNYSTISRMLPEIFGLGLLQVLFTALSVGVGVRALGFSAQTSAAIGAALSMSSTALVVTILKSRQELRQPLGKSSFGLLLFQDMAVVPVMIMLNMLSSGSSKPHHILQAITRVAGAAGALFAIKKLSLVERLLSINAGKPISVDALFSGSVAIVLLLALGTELFGVSPTLGAFIGGMMAAETSFRYKISDILSPIKGLLMSMFFLNVGFNVDFSLIRNSLGPFSAALFILLVGKTAITTISAMMIKYDPVTSLRCGIINSQAGEFSLLLLETAFRLSLITELQKNFLLTLVVMSMFATPLLDSVAKSVLIV